MKEEKNPARINAVLIKLTREYPWPAAFPHCLLPLNWLCKMFVRHNNLQKGELIRQLQTSPLCNYCLVSPSLLLLIFSIVAGRWRLQLLLSVGDKTRGQQCCYAYLLVRNTLPTMGQRQKAIDRTSSGDVRHTEQYLLEELHAAWTAWQTWTSEGEEDDEETH